MADEEFKPMEWTLEYSVNEERMDKQHQWLFELFNQIILHLAEEDPEEERRFLLELIGELEDYTRIHFTEEENLMKSLDFPDIDSHILEHRKFEQKVREFKTLYTNALGQKTGTEVFSFLREWLSDHILIRDNQYKKLIK
jgi:hemerythrin